jgi:alpha-amylase
MKRNVLCLLTLFLFTTAGAQKTKDKEIKNTKQTTSMNNFKKADWINNTDVYEVNVRQYSKEGTFNAFANELPRLKKMGVSTLWFMPVTPIAQKNKKGSMGSPYACSDYTAINPELGSLNDFKALVKKAHDMGFKVIIDWVANHTGWDHKWTTTHPDYYEKDPATKDFKIASGMDDIIELDFKNPALRKAMIDAMLYWVKECDIDGFRCDLASWVEVDFWVEARTEIEKTKTLYWLAECDGIDDKSYYAAFDACYTWTWMHKTEDFYKKQLPLVELTSLLEKYNVSGDDRSIKLWFTTNHDENSWNGSEYEKYGDAAKAFAIHSFTWNGIPLIYSGQELPNTKRLKFFEKDPIEWNGSYAMEDFYTRLLALKKRNKALNTGDAAVKTFWVNTTDTAHILAYLRKNENKEVLTLINMSATEKSFSIVDDNVNGVYNNVFANEQMRFVPGAKADAVMEESASITPVKNMPGQNITLGPWQYLVLEK